MHFFGGISRKPNYLLIDRIPASVGPSLLGRIVLDPRDPTGNFRPKAAAEEPQPVGVLQDIHDLAFADKHESPPEESIKNSKSKNEAKTSPPIVLQAIQDNVAADKHDTPQTPDKVASKSTDYKTEDPKAQNVEEKGKEKQDMNANDSEDEPDPPVSVPMDAATGSDQKETPQKETPESTVRKALDLSAPIAVLKDEQLEIVDEDFSILFSKIKDNTARASVGSILGISVDDKKRLSTSFQGKYIRTRRLIQHYDTLKALIEKHRLEVVELLKLPSNGRAYMVIGYKSTINGKVGDFSTNVKKTTMHLAFPTEEAVRAATHGAANIGPNFNLNLDNDRTDAFIRSYSAQMQGEQIFAVRYRIITYKEKHESDPARWSNWNEGKGEYRVDYHLGVYSPRTEDGEGLSPSFEEDDFDQEEEEERQIWDDPDIHLSAESVASDLKRFQMTGATVIEFDEEN